MSTSAAARTPVTVLVAPVFKTDHQEVQAVARAAADRLAVDGPVCLVEMSGGFGPDSVSPDGPLLGEALDALAAGGMSAPGFVVGWDEREYGHGDIEVAADLVRLVLGLRDRGVSVVLIGPMVYDHEVWWYSGIGTPLADRLLVVADQHLTEGLPALAQVLRIGARWPDRSRRGALLLWPTRDDQVRDASHDRLEDLIENVLDLSAWLQRDRFPDDPERRTYPGLHKLLGLEPNQEDLRLLDEVRVVAAWDALNARVDHLEQLRARIENESHSEDLERLVGLLHDAVTVLYEHEAVFRRGLGAFGFWPDAVLLVARQAAALATRLSARSLRELVIVLLEVGSFTSTEAWPGFPLEIQEFFPDTPVRTLQRLLAVAGDPRLQEMATAYAEAIDQSLAAAVGDAAADAQPDFSSNDG